MGNPAEMLAAQNLKAGLLKRGGVFFKRWKIAFFCSNLSPIKFVLQCIAESRKAIVHVDHHANSSGCKQAEDVARTIELPPGTMTVADGIYADNELEIVLQMPRVPSRCDGEVLKQR